MVKGRVVTVHCKDCNKELVKEAWTLKKWQGRCQPCSLIHVRCSRYGKDKDAPVLRRKVYATVTCSGCGKQMTKREDSLKGWGGRCRSCGNGRRNPDRDAVARNDRARRESYSLIHNFLRRAKLRKQLKSSELLGYSPLELYEHITRNFKPGMSWENRGAWHIDHKKSVAEFAREGITDPAVVNALSNLEPLWKADNLAKGCKSKP